MGRIGLPNNIRNSEKPRISKIVHSELLKQPYARKIDELYTKAPGTGYVLDTSINHFLTSTTILRQYKNDVSASNAEKFTVNLIIQHYIGLTSFCTNRNCLMKNIEICWPSVYGNSSNLLSATLKGNSPYFKGFIGCLFILATVQLIHAGTAEGAHKNMHLKTIAWDTG